MRKPSYTKSHQIGLLYDTYSPQTLRQLFPDEIKPKQPKKKTPNRSARSKGNKAEALLQQLLEEKGYEVRRTHLSAYPDIIAWSEDELMLIEVKSRTYQPDALSRVKSVFKTSAKTLTSVPNGAKVLCYVHLSGHWVALQCINGTISQIQSIVGEERLWLGKQAQVAGKA